MSGRDVSPGAAKKAMMERYVTFVVRHRVAVLVAVLLATAAFATQLRHLRLEIRRREQLPQDHVYVQIQNRITDLFGGEAIVIIGVIAKQGDIFTPAILGKVYRITESLRSTPGVIESSLFSLAAPHVKAVLAGADDMMEIRPVMAEVPTNAAEIERIRKEVREDHLFRGNVVSQDETATVIIAEFDDRLNDLAIAERLAQITGPERDATVAIALAGAPVLRAALTRYTAMIAVLFPLAVLVIGVVHYEAFRTIQAMLLPLLTALLSVIWALGIMGALRLPMDTWSAMTPVVILAVAAGHAVQILKRYYEEYARCGDSQRAVVQSATAVGPIMLTAGLIAAAGFASLMSFGISSVRIFGLLLSSGILSALMIEMTFTPACRSLLPAPKRREVLREERSFWLDRGLEQLAGLVTRHPRTVLIAGITLAAVATLGAFRIRVDNSFRFWFSSSTQVRIDDAILNEKLPGSASLRILVEGRQDEALTDPAVLQAMSDLQAVMASDPRVGGVTSIADHVKRMHQAMNHGDPAFYRIPENRRLISEYLFLYGMAAGPDDLSGFVDAPHRAAVIRALSKTDAAEFSRQFLTRLQAYTDERFRGLPVTVGIAGGTLGVQTAMNDVVVHEKLSNMIQVALIIFGLSAVVFRSFVGGCFILTPLVLAVAVNLGIMGWTQTWLDMATAAFNAMGVSIGADFAIYLAFRIREEMKTAPSVEAAIHTSLRTSGKAIFFVSSAVALGYLVLVFSGFSLWVRLGVLTATLIGVSSLATLTVLPALVLVTRPQFLRPLGESAPRGEAVVEGDSPRPNGRRGWGRQAPRIVDQPGGAASTR